MNKKQFVRPALLLAVALAFAACSNDDILVDNPDPKPTDGKMKVSITGAVNDEGRDTRSSFVYGEPLSNTGNDVEKFQWNANDGINLRFSSQSNDDFNKNVLSAPADLKEGQNATTFSGTIDGYTGKQTIYAVSPAIQIGRFDGMRNVGTLVEVSYPLTVTQKGTDLSHLGATDYMWARVKDFDLGDNGENLKNAQLNFEHLGAMLRFQIKNTSKTEGKKYTLQSVTVSENKHMFTVLLNDYAFFDLGDVNPVMKYYPSPSPSSPKIIEVEGAEAFAKDKTFDAYMMVPASPEGTDLRSQDPSYRFVVKVVVIDEKGEAYYREIEIDPGTNGKFINNGFAAGMRYYFVISVDEDNLVESSAVVNVKNAGSLETLITNPGYIANLTVTGNIDMRDLFFMGSMPILSKLDLSRATIEEYKDFVMTYEANTIPNGPFTNKASLRYITLPNNLTAIDESAFSACSGLTGDLFIPASVKTIGKSAFSDCSGLTGNLTIPVGVESIGNYAFSGCSGLTGDLTIPVGVETIGDYAFSGCSGLTGDLTIHASVTAIGDWAFEMTNLSRANLYWGTKDAILEYNINWNFPYVTTTVPKGTKNLYDAKNWPNLVERDQ